MSNWMALVVCAVVGWLLVSLLFRRKPGRDDAARPPPPPPLPPPPPPNGPAGGPTPAGSLSVTFLGLKWHELLGVSRNATEAEIDAAYYAIIAEFDRLAFDRNATDEQKRAALARRHGAAEAYQFIRAARGRR